ncbi:SLC13 family permease [Paenibacillus sp. N3.4]|uniref:SLC13 family permease n=1 Tax=Paenibacillus sp. N3.4 TaxID=2603222 RepID=UPI0011CAE67A|nr:SLC13 family permease [Paenibacillus sp. N3.4]TXK73471.1 hypothetical protein FU659_30790 [Paenibacillus sp. N3.4]
MHEFSHGPVLWQALAALLIFAAAYVCILIEKWDRTYTALGGALLMVVLGIIPLSKALSTYAHWHVLLLIASLFIMAGIFQKTGLIAYSASCILRKFRLKPFTILLGLSILVAVTSALLDSLLAIAVIIPIMLSTTKTMKISPVPFLISAILSANIGGAATLIGNLPNRMVGTAEHMTAGHFLTALAPLVIIMLIVVYLIIWILYRKKMIVSEAHKRELFNLQPTSYLNGDRTFLIAVSAVTGLTLIALFIHGFLNWNAAYIAGGGAFILLALNYKAPTHLVKKKDYHAMWSGLMETQLLFFLGLFIMVGGLTYAGISGFMATRGLELSQGNVSFLSLLLLWLTGFGSAVVDHIPYIAGMIPIIELMGTTVNHLTGESIFPLWWSLLIGSAIGSGVTLLGSTSSMYAAALSEQEKGGLTQQGYFIVAAPISLLLFVIATVYFKLFLL